MNSEEINKLLKDNPIKIIKIGDIEVPVEYLKQTTININGDDYIRLQQENKQLKDNWNKLKEFIKSQNDGGIFSDLMIISDALNKMQELEKGDSNEKI